MRHRSALAGSGPWCANCAGNPRPKAPWRVRANLTESGVATRVLSLPGWNDMPAVREGRVCLFTRAQADVLVRPGPRLGEAARIVADCVQSRAKLLPTPKP